MPEIRLPYLKINGIAKFPEYSADTGSRYFPEVLPHSQNFSSDESTTKEQQFLQNKTFIYFFTPSTKNPMLKTMQRIRIKKESFMGINK